MSVKASFTYPGSARKFNINWRAFGLISLVMSGLVLCFLWLMAQWNEEQFENGRNSLHVQYQDQLERLIENSSETMIQLSSAVSFNNGLMEAITQGDSNVYEPELDALDWNLQTDSGMSLLGLYNLKWRNLYRYGEQDHVAAVQKVAEDEQPYWHIDCATLCRIVTYTALLHQGDVQGVLVLAEPLSNVMLRFQRVANINTGLLGDISQSTENQIPSWQRSLMASTNPEESRGIIQLASEDYSLEDLSDGIGLISMKDALYELKAMSLKNNQVVVISEASEDYNLLHQSKGKTIQNSVIALLCGEMLLLLFLWRPLRKIKLSEQLETFAVQQAELLKEKTVALSKAESLSQNLCDSMTAAVLILGEGGKIKYANNYFLKLLGRPSDDIMGHSLSNFVLGEGALTHQRILDVYQGLIDEYEHVGRIESYSSQVHRMMWRYVPSYFTGEYLIDELARTEELSRSIVAIGMPLTLPTLESEQTWLDSHDPQTGLLNRQAAYDLIEQRRKGDGTPNSAAELSNFMFLLRFGEKAFISKETGRDCLTLLSIFASEVDALDEVSQVKVARMDENEVAIMCRISQAQAPQFLKVYLLEIIQKLMSRCNINLGEVNSAFIDLDLESCPPYIIYQKLQNKL